jgi:hypothetical protein
MQNASSVYKGWDNDKLYKTPGKAIEKLSILFADKKRKSISL